MSSRFPPTLFTSFSRMDPTVDFNRSFAEYEQGFGTPTDEIGSYWIGLRNISFLTDRYSMRLNIRTVLCNGGTQFFADYGSFKVIPALISCI